MNRSAIILPVLLFVSPATAAIAKSITCSYPHEQQLTFEVPKKLGEFPSIEFDYESKVTRFSFRDNNLLLVAMDESESNRVRVVISAQLDKAKHVYLGQIVTDAGGNQLMLDNGPVTCRVEVRHSVRFFNHLSDKSQPNNPIDFKSQFCAVGTPLRLWSVNLRRPRAQACLVSVAPSKSS